MKKLLLTICTLILVLCPLTASAKTYTDEAYEFVSGITDIRLDKENEAVTRADFLKLAVTAFDLSDLAIRSELYYNDVKPNDEIYGYLELAAGQEMITGSGNFRGNEAIAYDEALKICVSALGYNAVLDSYGGFPGGVRKIAGRCSLSEGIISGGNLSTKDAYRLILNTLKAPMCMVTSTDRGAEFYVSEKDNILNSRLGVYEAEGIMNMNTFTGFGGSDGSGNGVVEIEGIRYSTDGSCNDLIGMAVKVYYTDEDSVKEAVCIIGTDNDIVELNTLLDISFDGSQVTVKEESKTKKYKVKSGYEYIYNLKSRTDHTNASVLPKDGTVTLIDNNGDGVYDIINVREVEYMKVIAVNKVSGIIKGEKQVLETGRGDCTYLVYNNGIKTEPYELAENMLLAYSFSSDGEVCRIDVCYGEIDGSIGAIAVEDEIITIGETEYRFGKHFADNYLAALKPGTPVFGYLGLNGELVMVTTMQRGYSYGYLLRVYQDEFDQRVHMKVYTQSGEFKIFKTSEYVKADAEKLDSETFMDRYFKDNKVTPQLIRYYVNGEGLLSRIDFKKSGTELLDMDKADEDNYLTEYSFSGTYNYRQGVFFPYFHIEGTVVFKIPQNVQDEDLFAVNVGFNDGNVSGITPYDVDKSGAAGAIVYRSSAGSSVGLGPDNTIILVEKVVKTVNEDDDIVNKIYGWKAENGNGVTPSVSFCEYYVDDNAQFLRGGLASEPKRGDLIRVNIENDTITDVVLDFDGETRTVNTGGSASIAPVNRPSSALQYQIGSIHSIGDEFMYLSNTRTHTGYDYALNNLVNVRIPETIVLCDFEEKKVQTVDRSYLFDNLNYGPKASYVLVKQHYMYSNFCIIFK